MAYHSDKEITWGTGPDGELSITCSTHGVTAYGIDAHDTFKQMLRVEAAR